MQKPLREMCQILRFDVINEKETKSEIIKLVSIKLSTVVNNPQRTMEI